MKDFYKMFLIAYALIGGLAGILWFFAFPYSNETEPLLKELNGLGVMLAIGFLYLGAEKNESD